MMVYLKTPRISILTPTWNRAAYLTEVWQALEQQTYRGFEWIVANDGSNDDTVETVETLARKSEFPVILVNASTRVGKSRIDNEAVALARGEFIVWCDSDDLFMPNALQHLLDTWETIPPEERHAFCGVTALCDTDEGVLGKTFPKAEHNDLSLNDLLSMMQSDLLIFTRAELLKHHRFPEVDFLTPESSVWSQIGESKTRFVPRVLKRVRYGERNCLSYTGLMEYNRGRAYALAITRKYAHKHLPVKARIIRSINYIRYCIHGEVAFAEAVRTWGGRPFQSLGLLLLAPFSVGLAVKDQLAGKVRKTHHEFLAAQQIARIESYVVNP